MNHRGPIFWNRQSWRSRFLARTSLLLLVLLLAGCGEDKPTETPTATSMPTVAEATPTATSAPTATSQPTTTSDIGTLSQRQPITNLLDIPLLATRQALISQTLALPVPVLPLSGHLSDEQKLAEQIALQNPDFVADSREAQTGRALRSEVFGIYPTRESDHVNAAASCAQSKCYRVEMYNYAYNLTVNAIVDIATATVLVVNRVPQTQPDIPPALTDLAIQIALNSPEVAMHLGAKPGENVALMANTKTALNQSRCERAQHLCVAPTFVQGELALWAIVDLTDGVLVGTRWTRVGDASQARVTEKVLQNEVVTELYCNKSTSLTQDSWEMDYILTSSDGLRLSDVRFKGRPILTSVKLVDWHVSYSGTDGFGYSDAVGCPVFSQAAVLALDGPRIEALPVEQGVGFAIVQIFRNELWPQNCNYSYEQRYEFYADGRFRVIAANLGRGCGDNGTYRPVTRIAFAGKQTVAEWNGQGWQDWAVEGWQVQSAGKFDDKGQQYRVLGEDGTGFYLEPGQGQWANERGDNAYLFVTRNHLDRDEGESDLVTIGPCCNTDHQQGPEKFIDSPPEEIVNVELVLWYVAQIENDTTLGQEYCWADFQLVDGVYTPAVYPCRSGPMLIPVDDTKK